MPSNNEDWFHNHVIPSEPFRDLSNDNSVEHMDNEDVLSNINETVHVDVPGNVHSHAAHSPRQRMSSHAQQQHARLRRLTRTSKPPLWTQDFVTSTIKSPPLSIGNFVQYNHRSTSLRCYLRKTEQLTEPLNFQ